MRHSEAIRLARKQSVVTHAHPRAQLCCALYALTALGIVDGQPAPDAVRTAEDELLARYEGTADELELKIVLDGRFDAPQGSGYVVDSFWSAIHCLLSTGSYEDGVQRAIAPQQKGPDIARALPVTRCCEPRLRFQRFEHLALRLDPDEMHGHRRDQRDDADQVERRCEVAADDRVRHDHRRRERRDLQPRAAEPAA